MKDLILTQANTGKIFKQTLPSFPLTLRVKPLGFAEEDYEMEEHNITNMESLVQAVISSPILGIEHAGYDEEELDEILTNKQRPNWVDSGWKVELLPGARK